MDGNWISFWGALLASVIGGFVAGLFVLLAVRLTHKQDIKREKEKEKNLLQGFYRAVLAEMETLYKRYQETMGYMVEQLPLGQALTFYYPLIQDYFTVYKTNAHLVGAIPNRRLREVLIKTHVHAQALVDSFRMNNYMLEKLENMETTTAADGILGNQQTREALNNALVDYARKLKESHGEMKKYVEELLGLLKDNIKQE